MHKKIVFLGTGGTIAGRASNPEDNVGYKAAEVGVHDLLDAIPGLQAALGSHRAVCEQVAQLDSKDMVHSTWEVLANRIEHHLHQTDVTGVVITHGTDTLEETAYFLSRVLPVNLQNTKPIVLTCAMRPATSQSPDGPQNMLDAATVGCSPEAHGVMVVCAGTVHDAKHVQKIHPYRVNAFDSGEAGPLAFVEEGRVRKVHDWPQAPQDVVRLTLAQLPIRWPRVEIVMSHAGAGGAMLRSLFQGAEHEADPVRGLVVAGTGNGTIHDAMEDPLQAIGRSGVSVLRSSRCAYGEIVSGPVDVAASFPASALPPVKARIALMLELLNQPMPRMRAQ